MTVSTPSVDSEHPAWCDPASCRVSRSPASGRHYSATSTVQTVTGRIDLSLEQHPNDDTPTVIMERRQCWCAECEPIDAYLISLDGLRELHGHLGDLLATAAGGEPKRPHPLAPPGGHELWCTDDHEGPCAPQGAR